ncbi:MAG: hypothetical protein QOI00_2174, partial [Chloroflexota bacterium]|nr:hypothetical protein [Chloroflexota bacterium]
AGFAGTPTAFDADTFNADTSHPPTLPLRNGCT